ncbi:uncharacterized protein [Amphiura filiformis]|uniref:uncharacterized protein n=1 Tax=Amphiura filiformis TaxID=82378 RepID=UPI003B211272
MKSLYVIILVGYIIGISQSMVIEVPDSHGYIVDPVSDSDDEITVDPLPAPGGVTFLGVGYNILIGNPEGGDVNTGGVDPGLLTTRKIFKLTYDENNLSNDLKYHVPDEVVFAPRESCVNTKTQEVFFGTKSYQEKVGVDISESLRIGGIFTGFKFSLSTRYQEVQSGIETSRYVFYEEKTVCNKGQARYRTELALHQQYPLDDGFVADACRLTSAYDEDLYMYFLEDWGTHIVSEVDVGTKATDRFEEEQQRFVHYAMTEIDNSVSARFGVGGYGLGIQVDMDIFKQGLTSEMKFGRKTHTYTSGSDDMHEPIGLFLLGMHEAFDVDYWQLINQYVADGLCSSSWINDLGTIQANVLSSIQGYAEWKNANPSDDPIVEIPVTWPQGTYGLPRPATVGCPNTHFTWATGWRFQDTEDVFPDNFWSNPCHLEGPYWGNDAYQNFCLKTVNEEDIYEWTWPAGQYCIYQKGGVCPAGMTSGWVHWDDEDISNDNSISGEVPDGYYDHNTDIDFCCQTSGFATNAIYLPVDDSFFLFKYNHQCQEVYGMSYTSEYFRWDTEDAFNQDGHGGTHPYQGHTDNIFLEFCYYEPIPV